MGPFAPNVFSGFCCCLVLYGYAERRFLYKVMSPFKKSVLYVPLSLFGVVTIFFCLLLCPFPGVGAHGAVRFFRRLWTDYDDCCCWLFCPFLFFVSFF